MSSLPRYSPSAAETHALCPRRWFFDKVVKLPREADPTLAWGTAVHLVLENYLRDGVVLAPGAYNDGREVVHVTEDHITRAQSSFGHLPAPGTWKVELWVPPSTIGGMQIAGKIDLYSPEENAIADHKSTKTINTSGPYAVTPAKLRTNGQGLFYAGALIRTGVLDGTREVRFSHNYVQRVGAVVSRRVNTTFTPEQISEAWGRSEARAHDMVEIAKSVSATVDAQDAVPYDTGACHAFNRPCPAMAVCRAHTRKSAGALVRGLDEIRSTEEAPVAAFFDRFKPGSAGAQARQVNPTPAVQITPPDAVAVDVETVQAAFIADCATVLKENAAMAAMKTSDLTYGEVVEALRAEHLPAEYHPVVAALVGAELPENFAYLRSIAPAALGAGWPNTAESFRTQAGGAVAATAEALLSLPAEVAAEVAVTLPRTVVTAAVQEAETTGATEHAAALADVSGAALSDDALLDVAQRRTTDPIHAQAAVAAYEDLRAGRARQVGIDDADKYLRAAGRQRVRHAHKEEFMAALGALPGVNALHGLVTYGRPATTTPPAPETAPPAAVVAPETAPAPPAAVVAPAPPLTAPLAPPDTSEGPVLRVTPGWQIAPVAAPSAATGVFVLVIGASVRGVPAQEFVDIPWVKTAIGEVQRRVAAASNADYREWNDYGRTWTSLVAAQLDRALASGEELPAGWFWLDRNDALAEAKTGIRAWVKDNGGVVVG